MTIQMVRTRWRIPRSCHILYVPNMYEYKVVSLMIQNHSQAGLHHKTKELLLGTKSPESLLRDSAHLRLLNTLQSLYADRGRSDH